MNILVAAQQGGQGGQQQEGCQPGRQRRTREESPQAANRPPILPAGQQPAEIQQEGEDAHHIRDVKIARNSTVRAAVKAPMRPLSKTRRAASATSGSSTIPSSHIRLKQ